MTNSDQILTLISSSVHDDTTIAAALDALREDTGCDLLGAVLNVAHTWNAGCLARQIAAAAKALRSGSPIRSALMAVIVAECPLADEDGSALVTIVTGDVWPHLLGGPIPSARHGRINQHIGVGALWVNGRAAVIRSNLRKAARAARRRRSR